MILAVAVPLVLSCGGGSGTPSDPPPARLLFTTEPAGGSWGTPLADQPVVSAVDDDGTVVDTVARTVTLTLIDGGAAQLGGTLSLAATSGIASFTGLLVDRPAFNVRLVATAAGLAPDTTAPFTIGGPGADHLVFTSAPTGGTGGTPFATQPVVEVRTAAGQVVPWFAGDVTIARTAGSPAGSLLGTTTRPVVNGVATFTGIAIDTAGAGYALVASAAGLAPDTTGSFAVTIGFIAGTKSSFLPDGTALFSGDSLGFTLTARDAGGNLIAGAAGLLVTARVSGTSDGAFGAFQDIGGGAYRTHLTATVVGTGTTWRVLHDGRAGPTSPTVAVVGVSSVSTGDAHTCATLTTGALYCWGESGDGRLGLGGLGDTAAPVRVGGDLGWSSPQAGWEHTCALRLGAVWCWGDNSWGQVLTGDNTFHSTPFQTTATAVAQLRTGKGWSTGSVILDGGYNTCVRRTTNAIWCAGDNRYGQLGDDTNGFLEEADTLQPILGGLQFADLSVGAGMACGLTQAGAAYCWGDNSAHQLGRGSQSGDEFCSDGSGSCRTAPAQVALGITYSVGSLDAGVNLTCATSLGTVICWGGLPIPGYGSVVWSTPTAPGLVAAQVAVGAEFFCARAANGSVTCYGSNEAGQLGTGAVGGYVVTGGTFAQVTGGRSYTLIDAGGKHACGVEAVTGFLYCWGANTSGQLGDGSRVTSPHPVRVRFPL